MGARLALEALLYYDAPFLSLTCMSTTLEIKCRSQREKQEALWIDRLKKSSIPSFIKYWYNQKIFLSFSIPEKRFDQNKESLLFCLKEFSILNQPLMIEKILKSNKKIQFIYRKNDPKATPLQGRKSLYFINNTSHCIHLEAYDQCKILIENFLPV